MLGYVAYWERCVFLNRKCVLSLVQVLRMYAMTSYLVYPVPFDDGVYLAEAYDQEDFLPSWMVV